MTGHRSRTTITSPPPPTNPHALWSHPGSAASDTALTPVYPMGLGRPQASRYHSDRLGITPRRPMHPPSSYPHSSALGPEGASGSSTPNAALKVFSSVKRSFSTKKSVPSASFSGSTAEETAAAQIRIPEFNVGTISKAPPTVQQIAAGLVTSTRSPLPRRTSSPMAPPPARSSLKKPITSGASSSSSASLASTSLMSTRTGSTTTAATSVASSRRPRFSLKDALFRRSSSSSPTPISVTARKAVRFHVDRSPAVEHTSLPPM
ncbi:hypothetical protein BDV93DRAFT_544450 [Ceratobasidium sp. AG-I]|nr:hypothetical protein BDV93DRAFT_544450 [Ceratobasidium sp. AG-I]